MKPTHFSAGSRSIFRSWALVGLLVFSMIYFAGAPSAVAQSRGKQQAQSLDFSEEDFTPGAPRMAEPTQTPAASARQPDPSRAIRPCGTEYPYQVVKVTAGDHLVLNNGLELQLLGVASPVAGRACHGNEAAEFTRQAVAGKCVRVEIPSGEGNRDASGRTLAYVYYRGSTGQEVFLNEEVVQAGHGTAPPDLPHLKRMDFIQMQASARAARRGLWETCFTWKSEREMGGFGTDPAGNKTWRTESGGRIMIRLKPLAGGSYQENEGLRQYDDGTVMQGDEIVRLAEGAVAPGISISDIQRAVTSNPQIHVRDFIHSRGHAPNLLPAYKHDVYIGVPSRGR